MKCTTVRGLLHEYVENNLSDSVSKSLSAHLQECEQCAAEEDLLRTLIVTLRSLPPKSAPLDFTEGVMEKLSQCVDLPATASRVEHSTKLFSLERIKGLSELISISGIQPTWFGVKMMIRSARFVKYMPGPILETRTGEERSKSLTKLPLALGLRW